MKKLALIAATFLIAFGALPTAAEARVFVGAYYGGYYGAPYPAYYYPYYVAPPPVVYAVPPAPPVIYASPVAVAPMTVPAPVVAANQTSPTFIDSYGRTCRHYEATSPGGAPYGTACLQPDGSWRTVP